jgi:hypothetical protein
MGCMATKQKWKGWITMHRKTGEALGDPLAGSRVYEFELPGGPDAFGLAEAELRRLWAQEGSLVNGSVRVNEFETAVA